MYSGWSGTKAVQSNASIVDDKINALLVRLQEVLRKIFDTRLLCDVEMVVFNLSETSICFQRFSLSQLRILLELLQGGFASALVARGKIDEEGPVVERRFGVLES